MLPSRREQACPSHRHPLKTERLVSAHEAIFYDGHYAVKEIEVRGPYSAPPFGACLRINHYWTKSVEEFFSHKIIRGDVTGLTELCDVKGLINAEKLYNTGEDHAIKRFFARLKTTCALAAPVEP